MLGQQRGEGLMIAHKAPRLDGPELPRKANAELDECGLVFDLLDAARKPGLMVDVGAHWGGSLTTFARAGWKVLAYEPDTANRARLEATMSAKPKVYAGVTLSPLAVSDESREDVAFFSSPVSSGISGLSAFHESHSETERITTTTLDDIVRENGLRAIDFLKIDVEGHEMSVLRGLDFAKVRPRAVVAEFEDGKTVPNGYSTADLASFFSDRGYAVYLSEWHPIERYGVRHAWRGIRRWPTEVGDSAWGNLVAFVSDFGDEVLNSAIARNTFHGRSIARRVMRRARRYLASA